MCIYPPASSDYFDLVKCIRWNSKIDQEDSRKDFEKLFVKWCLAARKVNSK